MTLNALVIWLLISAKVLELNQEPQLKPYIDLPPWYCSDNGEGKLDAFLKKTQLALK